MNRYKTALALNLALVMGVLLCAPAHAQQNIRRADAADTVLPPDVDPITRYRLPLPTEADMRSDEERKILEDGLKGPQPPLRLASPLLAKPLGQAHGYLKFHSQFSGRQVEIAVLQVSRSLNDQFEWTQWEEHGRADRGGTPLAEHSTVDIIKYCKPLDGLDPETATIIQYGRELLGPSHMVTSPTFAKALSLFGKRGVVDLTNLMALYVATATELDAYDSHLDAGQKPLLPPLSETPLCPQ
jgi:hypothetical protein